MTTREFFLERRAAEHPVFLKVLRALPADRLDYCPHERSPSARQLAWRLATELGSCLDAVRHRRAEWNAEPPPPLEEIVATFERNSRELEEAVRAMEEANWSGTAEFFFQGKRVSERPIAEFLWMIHFDAIHHRGQLTAYLRPMGGKVPAIYGPSADDPGR